MTCKKPENEKCPAIGKPYAQGGISCLGCKWETKERSDHAKKGSGN